MSNVFAYTAAELAWMEKRFDEIATSEAADDNTEEVLGMAVGMGAGVIRDLREKLSTTTARAEACERVVEAARLWRHGMVAVGSDYVDSDDGNAEPNLKRRPARVDLVDAIDAMRALAPEGKP